MTFRRKAKNSESRPEEHSSLRIAQESTAIDERIMKGFGGRIICATFLEEAQTIVSDALAASNPREKS
jgi:hypothetical protein